MKKLSIELVVLFLALCLGTAESFAQIEEKEFITIEIAIKKEQFSQKIKVPISKNPFSKDGRILIEGEFTAGGWATTGCTNCILTSEYDIVALAIPSGSELSKVNFSVTFRNKRKCNVDREFLIKRGENTKLNLKCGVKIIAYHNRK